MYTADSKRYETMQYNRCGASGLKLPIVSLGLWHNFGDTGCYDNMKAMCRTAFDHGITTSISLTITDLLTEALSAISVSI
mgnify:CR=1 FL=1